VSLDLDRSQWQRVKFGDLVENVNDYFDPDRDGVLPYVAGPHIDPEDAVVSDWGLTSDETFPPTFKRLYAPGDVLLHSRGPKKIAAVDHRGVTGEKIFVLRSKDSAVLDQRFLPWLLRAANATKYFDVNSSGSVNKFLNWRPLERFDFDLPPLDQQRRIADLLFALERHRGQLLELKEATVSTMNSVVSEWWQCPYVVMLDQLGVCTTGSTPSTHNPEYWDSYDVTFLTPADMRSAVVHKTERGVSKLGSSAGRVVAPNSVAVVCIGATLGKTSIYAQGGLTNQQITCVEGLSKDDAAVLHAILSNPEGQRTLLRQAGATTVPQLNKSGFQRVTVPWPSKTERDQWRSVLREFEDSSDGVEAELRAVSAMAAVLVGALLRSNE